MRLLYFTNRYFLKFTVRNMRDSDKGRNYTNRFFPSLSYLNDTGMDGSILQCTRMGFLNP